MTTSLNVNDTGVWFVSCPPDAFIVDLDNKTACKVPIGTLSNELALSNQMLEVVRASLSWVPFSAITVELDSEIDVVFIGFPDGGEERQFTGHKVTAIDQFNLA